MAADVYFGVGALWRLVSNLTLLCRYHHRQFLARGWTCRMVDRLPTWTPPWWVEPQQRPVCNARITTRHLVC
jgi:hypothetical protein